MGCSGETTTKQARMSGNDPNYPQSGMFTGEDGRGLIYSSDWKRVREDDVAPSNASADQAPTNEALAGLSAEERAEFEAWKAEQESAEFEAWKKSREQQSGAATGTE